MKYFSIRTLPVLFLLVVYIYSIVFTFFPLSTKIILEGIGLVYCFRYIHSYNFGFKKEYRSIFRIISAIIIWDIIICLLNGTTEFHYVKVILPMAGSVFGAHLIYILTGKVTKSIDGLMKLVVITIFLESLLTIFMKLSPSLYNIVSSVLVFNLGNLNITNIYDIARFFGIGNAIYFGVLPSCMLGVMTSVFIMSKIRADFKNTLVFFVMYIVIGLTSFFVARTSIALFGISVLLLIYYTLKEKVGGVIKLMIVMSIVVTIALPYIGGFINENEDLRTWAFGFIENQDVESGSAGSVIQWWKETDFDVKTLIFGDALYENSDGTYYKKVDVGFFRQIFYGGIIGLMLNLFFHIKILFMIYHRAPNRNLLLFLTSLFLSYLVILAKGDAYIASFFILYLVYYTGGVFYKKDKLHNVGLS